MVATLTILVGVNDCHTSESVQLVCELGICQRPDSKPEEPFEVELSLADGTADGPTVHEVDKVEFENLAVAHLDSDRF